MHVNLRAGYATVHLLAIAAGISFVDAVAGRVLHAHPDPSGVILASGAFLVVRRVVAARRPDIGAMWGLTFAATYLACFKGATELLVGWNQSYPWILTSQVQGVSALAGIVGGIIGARPTTDAALSHGESNAPTS
jgi:hypothetical protein